LGIRFDQRKLPVQIAAHPIPVLLFE